MNALVEDLSGSKPLNLLKGLDYSILQQCMHCGMCLPTCPTYDVTKLERHSPRGRIALMKAVAEDKMETTKALGEEMYYCLGCLACETACPAGVNYEHLFETARAEVERAKVLNKPFRQTMRWLFLKMLFSHPRFLRMLGRFLWMSQASGLQRLARASGVMSLLPRYWRDLEKQAPTVCRYFSHELIQPLESPAKPRFQAGMLTGCVQDILFSDINRDTVEVLLANGCEVHTPSLQYCCGSLHAHNGDLEAAREMARRNIDSFDLDQMDVIITNAGGCGSHLKHYDRLLEHDPVYAARAVLWSQKLKDIHEWLDEIGLRPPVPPLGSEAEQTVVTYHHSCHLCHGQKVSRQPQDILRSVPGIKLVELKEADWCCGSAGIYNITQPEMAAQLQNRKMENVAATKVTLVATANPGCHLQLVNGALQKGMNVEVRHPVSLLAQGYRNEVRGNK
jgi:glycolate oxidase iron-sulfur subunit